MIIAREPFTENRSSPIAEDDMDDCFFFKVALGKISVYANLTTLHGGVHLTNFFSTYGATIPDAQFPDFNMPSLSGIECIERITSIDSLVDLRVSICTTSAYKETVDLNYQECAQNYVCKPNEFIKLKKVLSKHLPSYLKIM